MGKARPLDAATVREINDALTRLPDDPDALREAHTLLESAVRRVRGLAGWGTSPGATFAEVVGHNVQTFRKAAGWTQDQLAQCAREADLSWSRVTVAEVERGARRVSLEELVIVAALFSIPVLHFLTPDEEGVAIHGDVGLAPDEFRELFLGEGGKVGEGSAGWTMPLRISASLLGEDVARPATDYWATEED